MPTPSATVAPQPRRRSTDVAPATSVANALVPLATAASLAASYAVTRHDPSFVAHLIAMAEQVPQTRVLRRAAIADVEAAYKSVANQNQPMPSAGLHMRYSA